MPIDYNDYPADWEQRRKRILKRAKNRCEWVENGCRCNAVNGEVGWWDDDGKFITVDNSDPATYGYDPFKEEWKKRITVVLTVAHLDHDEWNQQVKDERLMAMCQRHHIQYDAPEKQHRYREKKYKNSLFPYERTEASR